MDENDEACKAVSFLDFLSTLDLPQLSPGSLRSGSTLNHFKMICMLYFLHSDECFDGEEEE